jgi:hypothetical protein
MRGLIKPCALADETAAKKMKIASTRILEGTMMTSGPILLRVLLTEDPHR